MAAWVSPLDSAPANALAHAREHAPYLDRLITRYPQTMAALESASVASVLKDVQAPLATLSELTEAEAMRELRSAKQQTHLCLAAADLAGAWPVMQLTAAISDFADAACRAALGFALNAAGLSHKGLFLIALGKMGAHELNYSSDIDIAAFYDPDIFDGGDRSPGDAAARIIKHMVKLLDTVTGDGYVVRTDLRLRPDPRSTPVAVSTRMAEHYYESVGQNWERMVWIKARPFAGDLQAADDFLTTMKRFVWRQHLDYWTINDIQAIKAMINASADRARLERTNPDVKLGAGGIREIEFFAQTQQLILGGRDRDLRAPDTLGALNALQVRGVVAETVAEELGAAYKTLRQIEHRIQMRQDEQTHTLPADDQARSAVAALCGITDLGKFDDAVKTLRLSVHDTYRALFNKGEQSETENRYGNLVFTGVDDDPGTVKTLSGFGFSNPADIIATIRRWHRGYTPATKSARGRQVLTAILPSLLYEMGQTGEADRAFGHFCSFFETLPSGVQALSMLQAEDGLRQDLITTLALAPRIGGMLGRKPHLLEALIQRALITRPDISSDADFETAMDTARLYVRDQAFLLGHDLLHGRVAAGDSARAFSDLADWTIQAMASAAEAECHRQFGPPPGDWCVAALGRLGGQAMTAASDLDLMVLYAPSDSDASSQWFARFTKRLITALSAPTAEGSLYEVDMRLRPSGHSGPVAVRLSSFDAYYREKAWTWEAMALTRLRPIADRNGLGERVMAACEVIFSQPRDAVTLRQDVLEMRQRLAKEKPGEGFWDLKLGTGALVDLEFIIQHALLSPADKSAAAPHVPSAINLLESAGQFTADEAETLLRGYKLISSLQQVQRLALPGHINPETISMGLKDKLVQAGNADTFDGLVTSLSEVKSAIASLFAQRIGEVDRPAV